MARGDKPCPVRPMSLLSLTVPLHENLQFFFFCCKSLPQTAYSHWEGCFATEICKMTPRYSEDVFTEENCKTSSNGFSVLINTLPNPFHFLTTLTYLKFSISLISHSHKKLYNININTQANLRSSSLFLNLKWRFKTSNYKALSLSLHFKSQSFSLQLTSLMYIFKFLEIL